MPLAFQEQLHLGGQRILSWTIWWGDFFVQFYFVQNKNNKKLRWEVELGEITEKGFFF